MTLSTAIHLAIVLATGLFCIATSTKLEDRFAASFMLLYTTGVACITVAAFFLAALVLK